MAIPTKFGRYEIKSELGRGGMATVYHGFDPRFDREVAIKVLPREMLHDPQFRSRFERELKIVAALEHPSIVPVYDVGEENGQPYFVMRYMGGGSLALEIEKGKFSLQDAARIVEKIAQGLAYAHKKGVVHRDLKPDNILFDNTGVPFISDFGVAKLSESTGSLTGTGVIGTPAYMSPEQAQGLDVDGRSDVYGLGVIVYQMLSGHQPYTADTPMGVVLKHLTQPVPEILSMVPDLSKEVDQIIKTSMAKDRKDRYATALDLAKALNVAAFGTEGNVTIGGNATGVRSGVFPATAAPTKTSSASITTIPNKTTKFMVAGVVLIVVLAGFFLLRNQLFAPPPATPTVTVAAATSTLEATTVASTVAPTEAVATIAPTQIAFALACSATDAIPTPVVKETNKVCIQKAPYTTLEIPEGATYEVLDQGFVCNQQLTSNGTTLISCTGKQLFSFDLKVCQSPVLSNEELGKCSTDSTFNSANNCCAAVPPKEAGCTTIKVDIRGCP
ncbi:MAG: serine/threonine-protein kinase [Anaerolineales bacterium]